MANLKSTSVQSPFKVSVIPRFFYEPKLLPHFDKDGNITAYTNVLAMPCTVQESDNLRVKSSCAERGLTADRHDTVGFRKTLETISQSRNLFGLSFQNYGYDDLSLMAVASEASKHFESNE